MTAEQPGFTFPTQDKLAAFSRTLGDLAHELNNLLQPIIGLTQLQMESLPSDGTAEQRETRESFAMILESGHQARDVVHRVLALAHTLYGPVAETP